MEQSNFEKRFSELQSSFMAGHDRYRFKNEEDVWANVGSNPVDILFTDLANLYLESNDDQKKILFTYCGTRQNYLENLWYFIRRIGMLIHSKDDMRWLEIGIASALLDGGRADFRDLIISLVLLRYIAEKQKIDTRFVFDSFIQSADDNMQGILKNVRDHSKPSMDLTVHTFGPPEWKNPFARALNDLSKRK